MSPDQKIDQIILALIRGLNLTVAMLKAIRRGESINQTFDAPKNTPDVPLQK